MAGHITDVIIDEIKSHIDLADLISSYGIDLKASGADYKACCPFHTEKTPSFIVHPQKGFYHCFGCHEHGDAITFVQKQDGLSFGDAVRKLAEQCGIKIEEKTDPLMGKRKRLYALMAELAQFYHRVLLSTNEAAVARNYLNERDLPEDVQKDFLIGYAPKGMTNILKWAEKHGFTMRELADAGVVIPPSSENDRGHHRFGGRLIFTVKDRQGRVVAFSGRQLVADKHSGKYVNSPETLIFKKSKVLFGFDKAASNIARSERHETIVCEGQIDTIRLHVSGFPIAVASQGTAFTEEHVRMVKRVSDEVYLVFDDDEAGHKATIKTGGLFLQAGMPVKVLSLPGGNDPDSFIRTNGSDAFRELLKSAESITTFQARIERAKEETPDAADAVTRMTKSVLDTIAKSDNAVLREGMIRDASSVLGVSTAALTEEFEKVREQNKDKPKTEKDAETAPTPPTCEWLSADAPPVDDELAFCVFLMQHPNNSTIRSICSETLDARLFIKQFVGRLYEAWLKAQTVDDFEEFASGLTPQEMFWYQQIRLMAYHVTYSLSPQTAYRFVAIFWVEYAKRNVDRNQRDLTVLIRSLRTWRPEQAQQMLKGLRAKLPPPAAAEDETQTPLAESA